MVNSVTKMITQVTREGMLILGRTIDQSINQSTKSYSFKSPLSADASSIFASFSGLGWGRNRKSWQQYHSQNNLSRDHQSTWEKYCKKRNSFNRIFAHLVSILIKDRYQHTLSYYCGRRIRIFRHFSRLQRENLSASGFATSDHRHVDKLTSRPRTQSSEVIVGTHCVHRILVRDKI